MIPPPTAEDLARDAWREYADCCAHPEYYGAHAVTLLAWLRRCVPAERELQSIKAHAAHVGIANPADGIIRQHDEIVALRERVAGLAERIAALEVMARREAEDWAETDTHVRTVAAQFFPVERVNGDQHGVPSVEEVVDILAGLIAEQTKRIVAWEATNTGDLVRRCERLEANNAAKATSRQPR